MLRHVVALKKEARVTLRQCVAGRMQVAGWTPMTKPGGNTSGAGKYLKLCRSVRRYQFSSKLHSIMYKVGYIPYFLIPKRIQRKCTANFI